DVVALLSLSGDQDHFGHAIHTGRACRNGSRSRIRMAAVHQRHQVRARTTGQGDRGEREGKVGGGSAWHWWSGRSRTEGPLAENRLALQPRVRGARTGWPATPQNWPLAAISAYCGHSADTGSSWPPRRFSASS